MNINELSQEEFDALTPDEIRERAAKEDAEQSDDSDTDDSEELDQEDADEHEDDNQDSEEESDSEDYEESEESDEESDSEEDTDEEVKTKVTTKAPKEDKSETTPEVITMDPTDFQSQITASFKAAGKEYSFTDPKEIISLMQKGVHYTQKLQSISHLKGLNEVLTQNGLSDPEELAFLIDVKNGNPEAIAKLIQQHGIDTYDLDEDKAAGYQSTSVNIDQESKAVALREMLEDHKEDTNFNSVFTDARKWDQASQEYLLDNLGTFEALRDHKADGSYDRIMAELDRRNVVNPSKLPIMQQYIQIGQELVGDSGSAQNTQKQQPTKTQVKERVIVKRGNVDAQRKRVAPTKSGNGKRSSAVVKTPADIFNLSAEEFDNLSPEMLRKLK